MREGDALKTPGVQLSSPTGHTYKCCYPLHCMAAAAPLAPGSVCHPAPNLLQSGLNCNSHPHISAWQISPSPTIGAAEFQVASTNPGFFVLYWNGTCPSALEFQILILSADGSTDLKSRTSLSVLQRNEACAEVCSPSCWRAYHHTHATWSAWRY